MSQSDGKNKLKRIEFVFDGKSYKFALNPEEYQQSEPNRATVTQTKAGAWIDEFGAGVPTISFRGTTGFQNGTNDPKNGFHKLVALKNLIRAVYNRIQPGQTVPPNKELKFYNYTDEEYWVVTPITFDVVRSVARSLLYTYNITLVAQRKISAPSSAEVRKTTPITEATKFQ